MSESAAKELESQCVARAWRLCVRMSLSQSVKLSLRNTAGPSKRRPVMAVTGSEQNSEFSVLSGNYGFLVPTCFYDTRCTVEMNEECQTVEEDICKEESKGWFYQIIFLFLSFHLPS